MDGMLFGLTVSNFGASAVTGIVGALLYISVQVAQHYRNRHRRP